MPVKIYKIDASPPVRAVLMAAAAIDLPCEQQEVDLAAKENMTPEYLKKNPLHSVPLLEDGDFLLADSHAIITYLVSKYGTTEQRAKLYPDDLSLRATIDQRLYFDTSVLFPTSKALVQSMISPGTVTAQQLQDVYDSYEIMEKYLQKTKFVAGDHLTVADMSCVATLSSTNLVVPVDEKYPKLNAWLKALEKEDWYKKGNLHGLNVVKDFLKSVGVTKVVVKN